MYTLECFEFIIFIAITVVRDLEAVCFTLHAEKKRPFKCTKCERSYKQKSSLSFHLKCECGISPRFSCTQCGGQFTRKDSLQKHIINVHKMDVSGLNKRRETPFKCTKRGKSYKQKRGLDQHIKDECGKTFQCTLCKQNRATKGSLRSHLLGVHGIARRKLDKHGAGFKDRSTHPFKCDQCGRTYTRKSNLTRHLTAECGIGLSFACPQCDCRFKRKSSLKLHLIEIHNVEPSQMAALGLGQVVPPENQFKCDQCGVSYMREGNLKRHLAEKCGK